MQRHELDKLSREQLIAHAERLGVPRPRRLTQAELIDEIVSRTTSGEQERKKARGWLGRARDLLANVVERGLHLPEAARVLRSTPDERSWPAPPPPLATVTLAEIYAAQGHVDRALAVLDEVLARDPDHREALALRERLLAEPRTRAPKGRAAPPSGEEAQKPAAKPEKTKTEEAQPKPAAGESKKEEGKPAKGIGEEARAKGEAKEPGLAEREPAPSSEKVKAEAAPTAPASQKAEAAPAAPASQKTEAPKPAAEAPKSTARALKPRAATPSMDVPVSLDEGALPERYDVDEIVALAVDPRTLYLYWEVRPKTLARAQSQRPDGRLTIRVASVIASWDGPIVETRDLHIDSLHGDRFIYDIKPGSNVRVSIGWLTDGVFDPFAVGVEVTAPRVLPFEAMSREVARWEPRPRGRAAEPARASAQVPRASEPDARPSLEAPLPRSTPRVLSSTFEAPRVLIEPRATLGAGALALGALEAHMPDEEQPGERFEEPSWWEQAGGASELSRGGPGRRRMRLGARRRPAGLGDVWPGWRQENPPGGASELSRGGASELSRSFWAPPPQSGY